VGRGADCVNQLHSKQLRNYAPVGARFGGVIAAVRSSRLYIILGLAKTLGVRYLARAIATGFQQVQFAPELLPADLTGRLGYRRDRGEFNFTTGPISSNLIPSAMLLPPPPYVGIC